MKFHLNSHGSLYVYLFTFGSKQIFIKFANSKYEKPILVSHEIDSLHQIISVYSEVVNVETLSSEYLKSIYSKFVNIQRNIYCHYKNAEVIIINYYETMCFEIYKFNGHLYGGMRYDNFDNLVHIYSNAKFKQLTRDEQEHYIQLKYMKFYISDAGFYYAVLFLNHDGYHILKFSDSNREYPRLIVKTQNELDEFTEQCKELTIKSKFENRYIRAVYNKLLNITDNVYYHVEKDNTIVINYCESKLYELFRFNNKFYGGMYEFDNIHLKKLCKNVKFVALNQIERENFMNLLFNTSTMQLAYNMLLE